MVLAVYQITARCNCCLVFWILNRPSCYYPRRSHTYSNYKEICSYCVLFYSLIQLFVSKCVESPNAADTSSNNIELIILAKWTTQKEIETSWSNLFLSAIVKSERPASSPDSETQIQNKHIKTHTTIGYDFWSKFYEQDDKLIQVHLWDTTGQEKYRSLIKNYYRKSVGAFLVYDITNQDSFDKLSDWLGEIRENWEPGWEIMLVGNKSDLES